MGQCPAGQSGTAFARYYEEYLGLHRTWGCRLLHAAGPGAAVALLAFVCWSGRWWALALLPATVYACAWAGHFFFERNAPASWGHPWLAFLSYWRMTWDTLVGRRPF